ncbi:TPA: hypothetical protein ACLGW6_001352 [Salmonella enterica]
MRKQAFLSNDRSRVADWMTIQSAIKTTEQVTKKMSQPAISIATPYVVTSDFPYTSSRPLFCVK